jgi:hypothetical protein
MERRRRLPDLWREVQPRRFGRARRILCRGDPGCRGLARASEWCPGAPVPRSPLVARAPPTFDEAVTGPPAHFAVARWVVRFGSRRDAAHRGPLEASVTDPRTDFGADEGSARKIPVGSHEPSNHDLSASSRNASRRDLSFAHRHPSIASRRTREAIVRFGRNPSTGAPDWRGGRCPERGSRRREGERRATAAVPRSGSATRSLAFLGAEPCGWSPVARGVGQ